MVTAYLGIGSNIGDRMKNLEHISEVLEGVKGIEISEVSSVYETAPVGVKKQRKFYNAVVKVRTVLSPLELLSACKLVENVMGRKKTIKWGPRIADVDILLYGRNSFRSKKLVIPHKEMSKRMFVLVPLYELAPRIIISGAESVKSALKALIDTKRAGKAGGK